MEKQFWPYPAKLHGQFSALVILIALLLLISATAATPTAYSVASGVLDQELQNAIAALRSNGYNLFSNAIDTTDLRYQIPDGDFFTFFSPRDPNVFSLDMASDATVYIQILHYHVVPVRLSVADLRNLSSPGIYVETFLPHYSLLIDHSQPPPDDGVSNNVTVDGDVTVDGVRIAHPDLYIGSRIAVHGLDGILAPRFEFSDFYGELGFVPLPPIGSGQYISRNSPPFAPNVVIMSRSTPESSRNSRFRNRGKRHEGHHHTHGKRRVHGHRKKVDKEVGDRQTRHSKFSKFNRHLSDDF
ncbi:uncharacterized protein LOC132267285 [Cornus florida]|uniref:uncharacterized protein LOC132267285 n=1 Tax=Cornus florida TaxID=4283 RepID=UPI0028979209|nr:uncharacterized protein LOC132267285 [Cornus florida]